MSKKGKPPVIPGSQFVSVDEVDRLRRRVFHIVEGRSKDVEKVLNGTKKWDANQIKLYLAMLDKVMPNLNQSHVIREDLKKPMEEMTDDELRAVIAQAAAVAASHKSPDLIEAASAAADAITPLEATFEPIDEAEFARLEAEAKDVK